MAEKNIQQAFDKANAFISMYSNDSGLFTMVLCPYKSFNKQKIARIDMFDVDDDLELVITQGKKQLLFNHSELSALFALLYSFRDILLPEQE